MIVYSLTPTGVTSIDTTFGAPVRIVARTETAKGHHVVDQRGRYLETPILTSATWDNPTGPDQEGR